jgi:hypothetical protein
MARRTPGQPAGRDPPRPLRTRSNRSPSGRSPPSAPAGPPVHGDVEYVHPGHVEQGIRPSAPAHADATHTVIHVGAFIRIGCLVAADPEGPDLVYNLATPRSTTTSPTLRSEDPSIHRREKRGDLDETWAVAVIESLPETVVDDDLQKDAASREYAGSHGAELVLKCGADGLDLGCRSLAHTHAERAAPDGSERPLVTLQIPGESDVQCRRVFDRSR